MIIELKDDILKTKEREKHEELEGEENVTIDGEVYMEE